MILLLLILLLAVLLMPKRDCMTGGKPSNGQVIKYTNDMLKNQHVFIGGTLYEAKEKMPWIDPIIYEDARNLARQNKLNRESLSGIFQ